MAEQNSKTLSRGVDLVETKTLKGNPFCDHGPTLLFERFFKEKSPQKFYACSACRDRKECSFFQLFDCKVTSGKTFIQEEIKKNLFKERHPLLNIRDAWCFDCSNSFHLSLTNQHETHNTKLVQEINASLPTTLLIPNENKKAGAQFFFGEETCMVLLNLFKRMEFKNVLCVGTPSLHEKLLGNSISSLLLDIDKRFEYFYKKKSFIRYNMFNGFFFDNGIGQATVKKFLSDSTIKDTVVVLDPPFGGLVSQLAKMIASLCENKELSMILVTPYYMENQIKDAFPTLQMMDYKVSYTNHASFNNSTVRGSPVRFFTNIQSNQISLPKEAYRFCKICERYVYKANRHCKVCNKCTSKDGRTYVHCDPCGKCVKPDREHCLECENCEPNQHECKKRKVDVSCHVCGGADHKRKDCPTNKRKGAGKKRKVVKKPQTLKRVRK